MADTPIMCYMGVLNRVTTYFINLPVAAVIDLLLIKK